MGKEKGGFLTPKAIGNRIKAKGLQKLRWYCQMCQKQCRDENGFKCHTMSESHMRQMEMFSQNSKSFMDEFSTEFEGGMMEIIARKARSKRMSANQIYKEYISDKQHFHMNATIWETLTDFVMYLGREGKCEVDETEKGWFVTYIDRDPEKLRKVEERAKRERTELDAEERQLRDIERLVKRARETGEDQVAEATELQRAEGDAPIKIGIGGGGGALGKARMKEGRAACGLFGDGDDEATAAPSGGGSGSSGGGGGGGTSSGFGGGGGFGGGASSGGGGGGKARVSAAQQLMEEEERKRAKGAKSDSWLAEGIIVKVMNSSLRDGRYYKRKGTIERVVERYTTGRVSNKASHTRAAPHSPRRASLYSTGTPRTSAPTTTAPSSNWTRRSSRPSSRQRAAPCSSSTERTAAPPRSCCRSMWTRSRRA